MKKYWKIFGIGALVVGIVYYPLLKLYQYITNQKGENFEDQEVQL